MWAGSPKDCHVRGMKRPRRKTLVPERPWPATAGELIHVDGGYHAMGAPIK
jgi:hypothetical protein